MDDFAGTTIDTAKWTKVNPSTGQLVISQNNGIKSTHISESTTTTFQNHLKGVTSYPIGSINYIQWDIVSTETSGKAIIGLSKDADLSSNLDLMYVMQSTTLGTSFLYFKVGGVFVGIKDQTGIDMTVQRRWRIENDGTNIIFKSSTNGGTSYTTHSTTAHTYSGNFYPFIGFINYTGSTDNVTTVTNLEIG